MATSAGQATIRAAVSERYSQIGAAPSEERSVPTGREWAMRLGYAADELDRAPESAVAAFTGVGAPPLVAELTPGTRVLDLGCGAGLDALLAAWRVGARGRVYAVDFAEGM